MVQLIGMEIAVADAKPIFSELLRRANSGEEVIVTRHGQPYAKIMPVVGPVRRPKSERRESLEALMERSRAKGLHLGASGAELQQELNDDVEASWGLS